MNDTIGGANLFDCDKASLGPDRSNRNNSSLFLNKGYCKAPDQAYFTNSNFTIMAWTKLLSYGNWPTLVDFGNGDPNDNVYVAVVNLARKTEVRIYTGKNNAYSKQESNSIYPLDVWNHIGVVLNGTILSVYMNGTLMGSNVNSKTPNNVIRKDNLVGQTNWSGFEAMYGYLDEMKFYNRSLSQSEIQADFVH